MFTSASNSLAWACGSLFNIKVFPDSSTYICFRFDFRFLLNPLPVRTLLCSCWKESRDETFNQNANLSPNLFKLNLVFATLSADTASCITAGMKFYKLESNLLQTLY
jgi:hypothetical protein